jgi:hypothetical protein
MPLIFNNVVEVIPFMAVFPRDAVLGAAPSYIMLEQTVIYTCQRRSLTSGMPCPIIVAD